jgi:DNA (cytosine-5)-methyltransferase 1
VTALLAIDLCAGAGGLSLGLQRSGFDVLGVEVDADACETHRANVGPCELASIVDWHPPPGVRYDLVAGGVPCTDHTVAGKRAGVAGTTGGLFRELIRIGVECEARALLVENVPGMRSTRDAEGWTTIARIKREMRAAGYEPRSVVLRADRYGTPQRRHRLLIAAFRESVSFRWPAPERSDADPRAAGDLFGLPPAVTVREALDLGPGAFRTGLKGGTSPQSPQGMCLLDVDAAAPTVTRVGESLSPLDRPAPTVRANAGHEGPDPRASRRPIAGVAAALGEAGLLDRASTTIDRHASVPRAGRNGRAGEAQQVGAVRLSLEHRAALQGFPPGFVWHGATQASRDKQVGNAVPPQLGEAVGRAVAAALRREESE